MDTIIMDTASGRQSSSGGTMDMDIMDIASGRLRSPP